MALGLPWWATAVAIGAGIATMLMGAVVVARFLADWRSGRLGSGD